MDATAASRCELRQRYNATVVLQFSGCDFVATVPMAHPFASQPFQSQLDVQLLLAPSRQLSGDGQLRELMQERRRHLGDGSGGLWYLSPERLAELRFCGLELSAGSNEALAIREPRAAEWLQLRFGGQLQPISLSSAWLMDEALELPAPAPLANVG
jgi:hypothetical protein